MSDAPTPAAGWYHDPSGAPQQRWWSGSTWTDDVLPLEGTAQPAATPPAAEQPAAASPVPAAPAAPTASTPPASAPAAPPPPRFGVPAGATPPLPGAPAPYGAGAPLSAGANPYASPDHYPSAAHYRQGAPVAPALGGSAGAPYAAVTAPPAPAPRGLDGWPIWLAVLLPLVTLVPFLFWNVDDYVSDLLSPAYTYTAPPLTAFLPGQYWAILGLGALVYAGTVALAYADTQRLRARGVANPFAWGFAFLGVLVYVIGRTVVVRRRLRVGGVGPLLAFLAVELVAIIVTTVWTFDAVLSFLERISTI